MDIGQYWQEIIAIGTPFTGTIIYFGIKWIKNKLAGNVIETTLKKIKIDLGPDDYNALTNIIKNVGVKVISTEVSKLVKDFKDIKEIIPLIIAMSQTHLAMGVYDELPVVKEIVQKTLDNVE